VEQFTKLSMQKSIPVAGYTVAVGFDTTPQRYEQMRVRGEAGACGHMSIVSYYMAAFQGFPATRAFLNPLLEGLGRP
jgi:hypothetical protein